MSEKEWVIEEDEYGTWKVMGDVRIPLEPSPKYVTFKESLVDTVQEPTQDDYLLDLEFRMSKMEMGL